MQEKTTKIYNRFVHDSPYSGCPIPATVEQFKNMSYIQRLELSRKRPEYYRMMLEEAMKR